jgi:membrane-associated HD superfamily phosphohydrolase
VNGKILHQEESMSVALIKKDQAERHAADPLRADLEAAILAEREACAALASIEEALRRGNSVTQAAQAKLENAKHHVEKAKEGDARRTAAAVRNRSSASPDASGVRRARESVVQAEDDLEAAQGAVARIQEECVQYAAAAQWATVERMAAANAVLAPVARTLLDRLRDVRNETTRTKALLLELLQDPARGIPEFSDALAGMRARDRVTKELSALRQDAERLFISGTNDEERAASAAAVAGMQSFLARLATDATAEPPAIP